MKYFDYLSPDERELNPVQFGRRRLFKGGSSSSSASSATNATDNRIANDSGLVVTGGSSLQQDNSLRLTNNTSDSRVTDSGNTTNTNLSNYDNSVTTLTDGGSVKAAMDAATTGYANLMKATQIQAQENARVAAANAQAQSEGLARLSGAMSDVNSTSRANYAALLDSTDTNVARAYGGMNNLVGLADKLFTQTSDVATAQAAGFTQAIGQAYDSAKASATGSLDNKTIMILGLAGVVAVVTVMGKK